VSDLWEWVRDARRTYEQAGDGERVRMTNCQREGYRLRDSEPRRALELFTEGRRLAEVLGEPWWALFYDIWRVIALKSYLGEYWQALDLAVATALEARKPQYDQHPWKLAAFVNLVGLYIHIDPAGHEDAVRETAAYLETQIPPGPSEHRDVLLGNMQLLAMHTGNLDEALALTDRTLALADEDPDRSRAERSIAADVCNLCWIYWRRGEWDEIPAHATRAEELAGKHKRRSVQAEAILWSAVVARRAGDEALARRRHRRAVAVMAQVVTNDSREYFDALALYHELGGDLDKALAVREHQVKTLAGRGRLSSECAAHVERCELLARLGTLRPADVEAARAAALQLRRPEPYLERLERAAGSC
jgi:tetratricopeptide (TPR) repeat protein